MQMTSIRLPSGFESDFDAGGYLLVGNVVDAYVIVVDLRENVLCGCKERTRELDVTHFLSYNCNNHCLTILKVSCCHLVVMVLVARILPFRNEIAVLSSVKFGSQDIVLSPGERCRLSADN